MKREFKFQYDEQTRTGSVVIDGRTITCQAPRDQAERVLRALAAQADERGLLHTRPVPAQR